MICVTVKTNSQNGTKYLSPVDDAVCKQGFDNAFSLMQAGDSAEGGGAVGFGLHPLSIEDARDIGVAICVIWITVSIIKKVAGKLF